MRKMDVEKKIKEMEENIKNRVTNNMITQMRQDIESKLEESIKDMNKRIEDGKKEFDEISKGMEDIKKEIGDMKDDYDRINRIIEELRGYTLKFDKIVKKIKGIEEIVGVEERIDVGKIPANILQLVYQYTLDDAVSSLRKLIGIQDSERILIDVLQDVRTKTSGTELFKYRDGRIITRDIARAIDKKLISPKQVHLTYIEIMNKIEEYIPNYIPKNFTSLLRTKGQEYTIETTTENRMRVEMNERNIEKLKNDISYLESSLREEILTMRKEEEEKILGKFSEVESKVDGLSNELNKIYGEIEKIYENLKSITPYIENYKNNLMKKILESIPLEGIEVDKIEYPQEMVEEFLNQMKEHILKSNGRIYSIDKVEGKILDSIGDENISFSELRKRTNYDRDILSFILERMVNENMLIERRYGKGKKYKRR